MIGFTLILAWLCGLIQGIIICLYQALEKRGEDEKGDD